MNLFSKYFINKSEDLLFNRPYQSVNFRLNKQQSIIKDENNLELYVSNNFVFFTRILEDVLIDFENILQEDNREFDLDFLKYRFSFFSIKNSNFFQDLLLEEELEKEIQENNLSLFKDKTANELQSVQFFSLTSFFFTFLLKPRFLKSCILFIIGIFCFSIGSFLLSFFSSRISTFIILHLQFKYLKFFFNLKTLIEMENYNFFIRTFKKWRKQDQLPNIKKIENLTGINTNNIDFFEDFFLKFLILKQYIRSIIGFLVVIFLVFIVYFTQKENIPIISISFFLNFFISPFLNIGFIKIFNFWTLCVLLIGLLSIFFYFKKKYVEKQLLLWLFQTHDKDKLKNTMPVVLKQVKESFLILETFFHRLLIFLISIMSVIIFYLVFINIKFKKKKLNKSYNLVFSFFNFSNISKWHSYMSNIFINFSFSNFDISKIVSFYFSPKEYFSSENNFYHKLHGILKWKYLSNLVSNSLFFNIFSEEDKRFLFVVLIKKLSFKNQLIDNNSIDINSDYRPNNVYHETPLEFLPRDLCSFILPKLIAPLSLNKNFNNIKDLQNDFNKEFLFKLLWKNFKIRFCFNFSSSLVFLVFLLNSYYKQNKQMFKKHKKEITFYDIMMRIFFNGNIRLEDIFKVRLIDNVLIKKNRINEIKKNRINDSLKQNYFKIFFLLQNFFIFIRDNYFLFFSFYLFKGIFLVKSIFKINSSFVSLFLFLIGIVNVENIIVDNPVYFLITLLNSGSVSVLQLILFMIVVYYFYQLLTLWISKKKNSYFINMDVDLMIIFKNLLSFLYVYFLILEVNYSVIKSNNKFSFYFFLLKFLFLLSTQFIRIFFFLLSLKKIKEISFGYFKDLKTERILFIKHYYYIAFFFHFLSQLNLVLKFFFFLNRFVCNTNTTKKYYLYQTSELIFGMNIINFLSGNFLQKCLFFLDNQNNFILKVIVTFIYYFNLALVFSNLNFDSVGIGLFYYINPSVCENFFKDELLLKLLKEKSLIFNLFFSFLNWCHDKSKYFINVCIFLLNPLLLLRIFRGIKRVWFLLSIENFKLIIEEYNIFLNKKLYIMELIYICVIFLLFILFGVYIGIYIVQLLTLTWIFGFSAVIKFIFNSLLFLRPNTIIFYICVIFLLFILFGVYIGIYIVQLLTLTLIFGFSERIKFIFNSLLFLRPNKIIFIVYNFFYVVLGNFLRMDDESFLVFNKSNLCLNNNVKNFRINFLNFSNICLFLLIFVIFVFSVNLFKLEINRRKLKVVFFSLDNFLNNSYLIEVIDIIENFNLLEFVNNFCVYDDNFSIFENNYKQLKVEKIFTPLPFTSMVNFNSNNSTLKNIERRYNFVIFFTFISKFLISDENNSNFILFYNLKDLTFKRIILFLFSCNVYFFLFFSSFGVFKKNKNFSSLIYSCFLLQQKNIILLLILSFLVIKFFYTLILFYFVKKFQR